MSVETRENLGHSGADPENLAIGAATSTSKALFAYLEAELASFDVQHQAFEHSVQETEALIEDTEEALPVTKEPATSTSKALFAYLETELADIAEQFKKLDITDSPSADESDTPLVHIGTGIQETAFTPDEVTTPDAINSPLVESKQGLRPLETTTEKAERKGIRLRAKIVGGVVLAFAVALSPFSLVSKESDDKAQVTVAATAQEEVPTELPSTTTSTTEAPAPEIFRPKPGEIVGVLKIPAICEEIQVLEYSEQEELDKLGGTGKATVEIMNPDPTPTERCENVIEHERRVEAETGRPHYTRAERGNAAQSQPVAGHMTSVSGEGIYASALPGDEGHAVIDGHGSTFSAPFADLNVLKLGDEVTFEREDGVVTTYIVAKHEVLPKDDINGIYNYSHPDSKTTATLMNCSYVDGRTGSSDFRGLVRLVKKA